MNPTKKLTRRHVQVDPGIIVLMSDWECNKCWKPIRFDKKSARFVHVRKSSR